MGSPEQTISHNGLTGSTIIEIFHEEYISVGVCF